MLVCLYVMIAGLQCISMLPALSSCKVLVLVVFVFVIISLVCIFLYLYMLVFLYIMIAGLQCISMLPALSSCTVLVFVVLRKFLTAFIYIKKKQEVEYASWENSIEPKFANSKLVNLQRTRKHESYHRQ